MAKEIRYTCLRKARIHGAEKYRRYHKAAIRNEDFVLFHKIDRDLYTLLVLNLDRDAAESMLVVALFLWLERLGCQNLVFNILSSPLVVINMYADEAVVCLKCIYDDNFVSSSTSNDISMLRAFSKSDISLHFLHDNRANAIECINKIVRDVCDRALRDIMERAMQRYVTVNGEEHPDDRTMFVTFSKGYPVSDTEVKEFFDIAFGECVESIQMQEVPPDEQPLFARVVLSSGQKVDQILNGAEKIKFAINGKHVWGRKFVSKRPRFPTAAVAPMPQQLANVLSSLSLN